MSQTNDERIKVEIQGRNKENSGGYYCTDVEQINMLLIGRTQSGKSTIFEALKNPEFSKTEKGFSITREPVCNRTILIDEKAAKAYILNVIDTPGLREVSENGKTTRSDEELLRMARQCIEGSLTTLNIICLVSRAGKTHQQDVEVFGPLMSFLGKQWESNTLMILTHADGYTIEKLDDFQKDIKEHLLSKNVYNYCNLGVCYHGIVNIDAMNVYGENPEIQKAMKTIQMKHLTPLRVKLCEKIISTARIPRSITQLADVARDTAVQRQRVIDEALKKQGCRIS